MLTKEYYIQHKGYEGNSLLFWRKNNDGYTTDLNRARVVTLAEGIRVISSRPKEDFLWLKEELDAIAIKTVHCELLGEFTPYANTN